MPLFSFTSRFLPLFMFALPCIWAHADTLDYWHVYQSHKLILQLSQNSEPKIWKPGPDILRRGNVFILRYFRDTPCDTCWFYVEARKGNRMFRFPAKGTGALHFLVLGVILRESQKNPGKWAFWYVDREKKSQVFLFDLMLP